VTELAIVIGTAIGTAIAVTLRDWVDRQLRRAGKRRTRRTD